MAPNRPNKSQISKIQSGLVINLVSNCSPDRHRSTSCRLWSLSSDLNPGFTFGPEVETRLPSWWWVVVVVLCWCSRQDRRCSLGPQQTVNSLQLRLWQDEAVDLLLAAGTRHHDPTHQHRVALLLLLRLKTEKVQWFSAVEFGKIPVTSASPVRFFETSNCFLKKRKWTWSGDVSN